jgi:phosphoribosylformylglycinamidine (FGAM) synthase-like enzyme
LIVKLIREQLIESAHDCSEGGLAIALAECTFDNGGIGVTANIAGEAAGAFSVNAVLFGESASRIVISVDPDRLDTVLSAATAAAIPAVEIGNTGGDRIRISVGGRSAIDSAVADAERAWATAIERKMQKAKG